MTGLETALDSANSPSGRYIPFPSPKYAKSYVKDCHSKAQERFYSKPQRWQMYMSFLEVGREVVRDSRLFNS